MGNTQNEYRHVLELELELNNELGAQPQAVGP
jgi:hypothetical protein